MTSTPINVSSVSLATVAAGPLFLLGLCIGVWSSNPGLAVPIAIESGIFTIAIGVAIALLSAMVFGSVVSLLPNLIGAWVMTRLSDRNEGLRLPLIWALAGAFACGGGAVAGGAASESLIALAFTGACCALICRRRIEWA